MESQKSSVHDVFISRLSTERLTVNLWSTGQVFMGHDMAQYNVELVLWERFLRARPGIKSIVELGSAAFGLSLYLALQAHQRGIEFRTFDHETHNNLQSPLSKLLKLKDKFIWGDIFWQAKPKLIAMLEKELPHPILLYCDNGDKPREFQEFVPHLQVGDYVGVHDWGKEIMAKDVFIFGDAIMPLYWGEWYAMGSMTRFMKVTRRIT